MDTFVAKMVIEDGKMRMVNRKALEKKLSHMNGNWRVTFERDTPRHSANLRKYFFGKVVKDLQEKLQLRKSEVYEFLMWKFDPRVKEVFDEKTGEILISINYPGSIRTMTNLEFGELIEDVCQWASESLHLYIQPPDKSWREHAGMVEIQQPSSQRLITPTPIDSDDKTT